MLPPEQELLIAFELHSVERIRAVLDAIQRQGYDVFRSRPTLSRQRKGTMLVSSWLSSKLSRRSAS